MTSFRQGSRRQIVSALQEKLRRLEGRSAVPRETVGSGCEPLDGLLPEGGFRRGKLVEWLAAQPASGAGTLSLLTAQRLAGQGTLVVLDSGQGFYPPAAAAWGIDLKHLLIVRPERQADVLWAWNQVLRCEAVAAAWGWVDRLDEKSFRRWQLAAEESGVIGFLQRPAQMRGQPSWADLQLWVEPHRTAESTAERVAADSGASKRRLRVQVTRCRGAAAGAAVVLELDEESGPVQSHLAGSSDETHPLHLVSALAPATADRRSTGT